MDGDVHRVRLPRTGRVRNCEHAGATRCAEEVSGNQGRVDVSKNFGAKRVSRAFDVPSINATAYSRSKPVSPPPPAIEREPSGLNNNSSKSPELDQLVEENNPVVRRGRATSNAANKSLSISSSSAHSRLNSISARDVDNASRYIFPVTFFLFCLMYAYVYAFDRLF